MKIWRFYILPENNNIKKSYDLYALTNDKEKAKMFMKTRNMDKFLVKCTKEDSETYANFANENYDHILDFHDMSTKQELGNGFYGRKKVTVLCTNYEYMCSTDEYQVDGCFANEGYWRASVPSKIFNNKIRESLKTIQYTDTRKIYLGEVDEDDDDDFSAPEYYIDELATFTSTFKHTFLKI